MTEDTFKLKFEQKLFEYFTYESFDFNKRFEAPIKITCITCGKISTRSFYNMFKSTNPINN